MKVCRHFAVVHGGEKPHKAPFFPRGDHQRKSLHRPCQPCGVFRLLPLYRRKKSAEFLCRKLFVLRIFDHPLFLEPFFSCMDRRILQAAPSAAGITDRRRTFNLFSCVRETRPPRASCLRTSSFFRNADISGGAFGRCAAREYMPSASEQIAFRTRDSKRSPR